MARKIINGAAAGQPPPSRLPPPYYSHALGLLPTAWLAPDVGVSASRPVRWVARENFARSVACARSRSAPLCALAAGAPAAVASRASAGLEALDLCLSRFVNKIKIIVCDYRWNEFIESGWFTWDWWASTSRSWTRTMTARPGPPTPLYRRGSS